MLSDNYTVVLLNLRFLRFLNKIFENVTTYLAYSKWLSVTMVTSHLPIKVYTGYILYVCSCGVWEKHKPSFKIYIKNMRICIKITKMARPHRRPL